MNKFNGSAWAGLIVTTVGWIHRAQDKDKRWALANTSVKLTVSLNAGNFLLAEVLY